jgi:sec-independent protein translocase protein TatB
MFNLDPAKLLIIAVVAVILLGPDKLPQVARQVGGAWRSFNEFRHRMETEVRGSIPDLPSTTDIARLARSPSALLNHLSTMDGKGEDTAAGAAAGTTPETPPAPGTTSVPRTRPMTPPAPMRPSDDVVTGDPSLN